MKRFSFLAIWLIVFGTLCGTAVAQESRASLGGKVTDVEKATIPNAVVTVKSVETGVSQKTKTNQAGDWNLRYLLPGHYTFTVAAEGFKTADHQPLELQVGDQKTADVQLEVGGASESVEVSSDAPLVDTSAAVSGTVVTTKQLEDTPTVSHIPSLLVGLTPGGLTGPPTGGGAHLWSNIGASTLQVNGLGSVAGGGAGNNNFANSYVLDGGYDNNSAGQQAFIPPQDAVAQFRVASNAYDASQGRFTGAALSSITKSGSKDFHGMAYEYNQNNFLNARPYNNTKNPPIHVNEYGANLSGPVWIPHLYNGRDRGTFFFFNADHTVVHAPGAQGFASLPTAAERTGDFSKSYYNTYSTASSCAGLQSNQTCTPTGTGSYTIKTQNNFVIYDPSTTNANGNRTAFASNQIPTSRIDPIAKAILALLPLPDNGGDATGPDSNNYLKNVVQDDVFTSFLVRIDQAWNNNNHSYLSLRRNDWGELNNDPFGRGNILSGLTQGRVNRGITIDHSVVLNPRMVLDLRYNVTNFYGTSGNTSLGYNPTQLGFSSSFAALAHIPSIPYITNGSVTSGGPFSGIDNGGIGTTQDTYGDDVYQTFYGSMTHAHGNHSFKYGFEHMIQQQGAGNQGALAGQFSFGNNWTVQNPTKTNPAGSGSGLASFLLGLPTSGSFPNQANAFWSQHYTALYFQDDWRVSPRMTINMGLRWDYQTGVTERHNKDYSRYNPTYVQAGVTTPSQAAYGAEIQNASNNPGIQLLQSQRPSPASFVTMGAIEYAGVHGAAGTVMNPNYKFFQPRFGIAYRLYPTTVVRGGFGRFVQADFITGSQGGFSQTTNLVTTTNSYLETNPITLDNAFSGGLVPPTGNSLAEQTNIGSITSFTDPRAGRIYADEASASLQQEVKKVLFEVGVTYNHSRNLALAYPTNALTPSQYLAAFSPTFDASGKPIDLLPGNQTVPNPYKGVAGLPTTSSLYTSSTVTAAQLLRPNPVVNSDIPMTTSGGKASYYAMLAKVEKRYQNGFSLLQAFTWGRNFTQDFTLGNTSLQIYIPRQIYSNDVRFHYSLAPIYELPFGRGKRFVSHSNIVVEELAGGWEVTGIYNYQSGTPIVLPTNSTFYRGDRSPDTNVQRGKDGQWFDTSAFIAYPGKSTCYTNIRNYPGWTGAQNLPGYNYVPAGGTCTANGPNNGVYNDFAVRNTLFAQSFGDLRNPPVNDVTLGVRKNFRISETMHLQLRMDAFNALNHPRYASVITDPTSPGFGHVGGTTLPGLGITNPNAANAPRQIELAGKLFF